MAIHVNNKAVLLGLLGVAGIVAIYMYYPSKESDKKAALQKSVIDVKRDSKESLLKKLTENNPPLRSKTMTTWEEQKSAAVANKAIKLTEETVTVSGTQVFKRETVDSSKPPTGVFLFLHGMKFSSKTWCELGTLNVTANNGYRAVAIDLPGFGQSKKTEIKDRAQFMVDLLKVLGLDSEKPIIVSPSMSGGYALPLLFQHPEAFKGYLPVAPVGVTDYKADQYKANQVHTCSIVGDKDKSMGSAATGMFQQMPNGETHTLENAGHPCYLDQPQEFHLIMFKFAKTLFGA